MVRRRYFDKIPLQANFYPLPAATYIEDDSMRFTVLTSTPLGMAALQPGQIEVRLHIHAHINQNQKSPVLVLPTHSHTHIYGQAYYSPFASLIKKWHSSYARVSIFAIKNTTLIQL